MVEITCGVNRIDGEYAGKSIADLRGMLTAALNIPSDAIVYANGEQVTGSYIARDGDSIEFVRNAGTKGN